MIISLDSEKVFDKIQYLFMIKVFKRSGIQGPYILILKARYSKKVANINLSRKTLKQSHWNQWLDKALSPYLFHMVLKVLARAIRQQKEVEGIQIAKEEVKVSLFADDMKVYLS